jgi:hypothetical protein
MTRYLRTRPVVAAGIVALALLVTACGGGSTKTATGTTTTTTAGGAARSARLAAYRQCLQSHGVTLPASTGGGFGGLGGGGNRGAAGDTSGTAPTTTLPPGVTEQQWQAAVTACASQLPARGSANLQNNPQFQVYYNCLQTYLTTHGGTTLPPLSQGGAGIFGGGGGSSTTIANPSLQAARDHCAALRPTFGGGTTTTSTP